MLNLRKSFQTATALAISLLAVSLHYSGARAQTSPGSFQVSPFVTGLRSPTAMTFAPDGRLFVSEKAGTLRVVQNGTLLPAPFVTITNIQRNSERGLLGIAFDPDFATTRHVFVYYTRATPTIKNRVSRFTASRDDPNIAEAGSETVILDEIPSDAGNHNGGAIHFGLDGKLYVATGDGGSTPGNSQNLGTLAGKLLRINADGSVPADNPFVGVPGTRGEVWAYGLRNPFTFAQDPASGTIHINDVGQGTWEEINAGVAGANYGWPHCEGPRTTGEGDCTSGAFTYPVHAFNPGGDSAIAGGAFYRGSKFPAEYHGSYFFGEYTKHWIRRLDGTGASRDFLTSLSSPVDIRQGPDENLYYLSHSGGAVHRIQWLRDNKAPLAVLQAEPTAGSTPLTVQFDSAGSSDPDGDQFAIEWDFGDGSAKESGPTASHTYATAGSYTARLTVTDTLGAAETKTVAIAAGRAPTGTIASPSSGTLYNAGDVVSYSASATDAEDGTLPPSAFTWTIAFHHDTHTHPFLGPITGTASGTFQVPREGEVAHNVWYRIHLAVKDSSGLEHRSFVDILPRKSTITVATDPAGLRATLDAGLTPAPFSTIVVVGSEHTLTAPETQTLNGRTYAFASWSDGGARTHTIAGPSSNRTYTAAYQDVTPTSSAPRQAYLWFDGVDDHVLVADNDALSFGTAGADTPMTIEAWIHPDVSLREFNIINKWSTPREYRFYVSEGNLLRLELFDASSAASPLVRSVDALNLAGGWHHVAAVYDGRGGATAADGVTLYVDGAAIPVVRTNRAGYVAMENGSSAVRIGRQSSSTARGAIDDLRLWRVARSASEIASAAALELSGSEAGLSAYWRFNEGAGATAADSTGHNATGTLVSGPVWTGSAPPPGADTMPPSVAITAPANSATVSGTTVITATASDNVAVAGVQFKIDGVDIGTEDTAAPYSVSWDSTAVTNGPHAITAVARDTANQTTTAQDVTVTVSNTEADTTAPTVTLSEPAAGSTVSGTATVTATAGDNVGVVSVQFTVDGAPLGGEDTAAPYTLAWDTLAASNGSHVLAAIARDAAGNTAVSPSINVTVFNDTTAPSVSMTAPANGATVWGTVTVRASASDNVGVAAVQFTLNGSNFGAADTASPYEVAWNTSSVPNGTYVLRAIARDARANTATSAPVTVTVFNDTTPPVVSFSTPGNGATVAGTITVSAAASDNGSLAGVRFTLNGSAMGPEDTAAPYALSWDTSAVVDGVYSLAAIARDAAGNAATATISVTVSNTAPPPVVAATNGGDTGSVPLSNTPINLPAGIRAGDLLIVMYSVDGVPALTWPAGWNVLLPLTSETTTHSFEIRYKIADGSETSMSIGQSGGGRSAHTSYRITGHDPAGAPLISVPVRTAAGAPDPPALTAGSVPLNYLWLAAASVDNATWTTLPSAPANYTNIVTNGAATGSGRARLTSARRMVYGSTEDPGPFTIQQSDQWIAATIAIRPGPKTP